MASQLTVGQRALLQSALVQRQHQLDRQLAEHHEGLSRVAHARAVLQQDGDDAPQRDNARETDLALTDLDTVALGAVSDALARLQQGRYGVCADCGEGIPFDRLKVEAWALRCVGCESALEAPSAGAAPAVRHPG